MGHWWHDGKTHGLDVRRVLPFLVPRARGGPLRVVAPRGRERLSRFVAVTAESGYEVRRCRLLLVIAVHSRHGVVGRYGGRRRRAGRGRSGAGLERQECIGDFLFRRLGYVRPADEG